MARPSDLFATPLPVDDTGYGAAQIEVLEGLEPVRRRPGMYVGGTDDRALHHLAAEILDNAMDEAVAGHANRIEIEVEADGSLTIRDNGRGIPVDPHPKFKNMSALEVILTTLHSGGKFSTGAYQTSGGLHGVGLSVVNALSDRLEVEVVRNRKLYGQLYSRGKPTGKLEDRGPAPPNRKGTRITFHPDPEIFGAEAVFKPGRLHHLARSKAYLYRGVEIRWACDPAMAGEKVPVKDVFHFPGGLLDYLNGSLEARDCLVPAPFAGRVNFPDDQGSAEWAVTWVAHGDGSVSSYCNTIPTPQGGTHEAGLRQALTKGLRAYGELTNNKRAAQITPDDMAAGIVALISVFIRNPEFQGQTKERLATQDAQRLTEVAVRDHFDHWLAAAPVSANALMTYVIERAEERLKRRADRDVARKTATRRLRLPGKLADCSNDAAGGTEIFLVEGDSAGGSAKQARDRSNQAILPLRGKILNVASAGKDKLAQNQELADLVQALGAGTGSKYRDSDLRYDKVIIMTDADVDGAHIASLLMTFFYREMPELIANGHLYLAQPPLYRLTHGAKSAYARDDAHKDELMRTVFKNAAKVDVSRFKGLGEMLPAQLKETTMTRSKRTLLKVVIPGDSVPETADLIERLMGRKAETRFQFIQENARFVEDVDV
jgi:topoisomerase-4 subunit B